MKMICRSLVSVFVKIKYLTRVDSYLKLSITMTKNFKESTTTLPRGLLPLSHSKNALSQTKRRIIIHKS
jgi:hypothetical protein